MRTLSASGLRAMGFAIIALGAAGNTVFNGSAAQAADYNGLRGSQIEQPLPPPSDMSSNINWGGFYFGGSGGLAQSRFSTDKGVLDLANGVFNNSTALALANPGQMALIPARRDSGITFGAIAGYNMMFGDAMLGMELDYNRIGQETKAGTFQPRQAGEERVIAATTQNSRLNDYASARLRFGYALGSFMPFATIGVAVGRFDTNVSAYGDYQYQLPANSGNYVSYLSYPKTLGGPKKDSYGYGLSLGGGVDIAVTDNLFVRGEYLYTRFNNVDGITVGLNTARVAAAVKF
jgi:outer membrane immunogenic protein